MSSLEGKVALVTGGSRGIGAAIVRKLAKEGANVAFTYVYSAEKANAIASSLREEGYKVLAIQADSAIHEAVENAVVRTVEYFGQLDILISNAGIIIIGPVDQANEISDQYDRQVQINMRAIPSVIRAAAKFMKDHGRIIIIGSVSGTSVGTPTLTEYGATKAAAAAYGRGYAWDLGSRSITVNTVQPGPIATDMNPDEGALADFLRSKNALKRYGTVEEVAALVAFLAGPDAGFITGTSINIDGGLLA